MPSTVNPWSVDCAECRNLAKNGRRCRFGEEKATIEEKARTPSRPRARARQDRALVRTRTRPCASGPRSCASGPRSCASGPRSCAPGPRSCASGPGAHAHQDAPMRIRTALARFRTTRARAPGRTRTALRCKDAPVRIRSTRSRTSGSRLAHRNCAPRTSAAESDCVSGPRARVRTMRSRVGLGLGQHGTSRTATGGSGRSGGRPSTAGFGLCAPAGQAKAGCSNAAKIHG